MKEKQWYLPKPFLRIKPEIIFIQLSVRYAWHDVKVLSSSSAESLNILIKMTTHALVFRNTLKIHRHDANSENTCNLLNAPK